MRATREAPREEREPPLPPSDATSSTERAVPSIRVVPAILTIAALWWAQALLIPVVLSVLVSYALEPAVKRLEGWHVRRAFGVPLLLAVLTMAGVSGVYALRGEAVAFADRLPGAAHTITEAVRTRSSGKPGPVAQMQRAASELERAASATARPAKADGITPVRVEEPTFRWNNWLWQGSYSAFELGAQLLAVVCLVYSLLEAGDLFKRKIVRIVGPSISSRKLTVQIFTEIEGQIERFLWGRACISGLVGVAVWVSFRLLGLEDPGVWGVLSALLFTVPLVGPTIVVLGAALAGFVQFESIGMAGAAAGTCLLVTVVEAYVLTPWLMSRVGEMNAAAIFVSLMFWGWLWGVWGLLLAVPITAAVKAVCERVDGWSGVAELLKA